MSVVDEYTFYENVYDSVQSAHDELTRRGEVGFVSAFIDANDVFVTITENLADARATIEALAFPGASFYIVGADIKDE